jgi:chromosome segregation ATPase
LDPDLPLTDPEDLAAKLADVEARVKFELDVVLKAHAARVDARLAKFDSGAPDLDPTDDLVTIEEAAALEETVTIWTLRFNRSRDQTRSRLARLAATLSNMAEANTRESTSGTVCDEIASGVNTHGQTLRELSRGILEARRAIASLEVPQDDQEGSLAQDPEEFVEDDQNVTFPDFARAIGEIDGDIVALGSTIGEALPMLETRADDCQRRVESLRAALGEMEATAAGLEKSLGEAEVLAEEIAGAIRKLSESVGTEDHRTIRQLALTLDLSRAQMRDELALVDRRILRCELSLPLLSEPADE